MIENRPYWLIQGGYGEDGGFGDYANPTWDEHPLRWPDGRLVWFTERDAADRFAATLTRREADAFHKEGEHGQYDGIFPYEYQPVEVWPADGDPTDVDDALTFPLHGGDSWNPVDDE